MPDYKIENFIPIPDREEEAPDELDLPDQEDKPRRGRRKKCQNSEHFPMTGKCDKCGDVFPCVDSCTHVDCLQEKNLPLPEWITEATPVVTDPVIQLY